MRWKRFVFTHRPLRRKRALHLEQLEMRLVPSTNVTAYHQASPAPSPASTIGAGVNSNETVLTPANVNSTSFGKLFATSVDGQVYAEPLYVENVNITTGSNQGSHNVVFVATQHDSLYAIDSVTGTILWHDALLTAEHSGTVTSVPNSAVGSSDISPEIGVTATPVIDTSNNTIFVENKTQEVASDGTHFEHHLYAIDLGSGAINKDVLIADSIGDTVVSGPSVAGSGAGSSGGVLKFDALRQMDRPGLDLINGNIYLAYASHGDNGPYHGWILGYSESSLTLNAVFNANPGGNDDGIWQGGGTLAYETVNGNTFLYFETGNGSFDTTLKQSPFNSTLMIPNKGDYGDSFVKVEIDGTTPAAGSLNATNNDNGWGMHVADYFTPLNEGNLSNGDTDLGSGAPLLLPASAGSAAHPNLMVGSGKEGRIYLIDRNNMGGYHGDAAGDGNSGTDNVVQETATGAINGSLDTPTFYNGVLYYVGGYGDPARTFTIANGVISSTSVTNSTDSYPFPGSTAILSTDPSGNNAVIWDIAGPGTNQLRAYSASQGYGLEIYTSAQAAGSRDSFGSAVKFEVPTVADGEVFVGTSNSVVAYGLLQQAQAAPAAPSNLSATAFSGSVIDLNWTDNDTNPNLAAGYNIFESTDGGTTFNQVATASAGATSFAVGGLTVSTTYYFKIDAFNAKGTSGFSNTANATTTNQPSTLDFSSGFANSSSVLTYNGSAKINGTSAELTDGGGTEAGSVFSTNAVDVTSFSTQFTFQLLNASADGFTFTIQGDGPTALGGTGGDLGYGGAGGIANSVAVKFDLYNNNGEGTDSTGEYTDGADPFTPSIDLTSTGIDLHSGDVFSVVMTYDGATLNVTISDTSTKASATQSYTVNIPQVIGSDTGFVGFTGGTGGQTAVQNVLTWSYSPTATTPPAAPSNLTGTVVSGSEIDISWTNHATNATAVLIDRSTDGVNFSQIASVSATTSTYADASLSPGKTYYYEVRATNAAGNSGFSNIFQATTQTPPLPPVDLTATNITTTEVDLSWVNVATNATGIKILEQLGSNSSRVIANGLPPTTTKYNIIGLTAGSPYTFEIDALNSNGPSGAATISVDTLPAQVVGLTAVGGPGTISLSWTADQGAVNYAVYRATTAGGEGAVPVWTAVAGTSFVDGTVSPGTTYYYTVTAVDPKSASPTDATGESAKSAEASSAALVVGPTINFSSGFTGATGLTFNGVAALNGAGLQLTDGGSNEAGSAFDNTPQAISAFSTQFTFLINGGTNPTADGFTFTIQNTGPTALGPSGGGLGYGPDTTGNTGGIGQSIAIKFDLYSNEGEGVDSTGLYMDGAAPTNAGSLDMTGSVDLHSGDVMQVNLTYDGSNLVEAVKDTITGGTFTHTYTGVDIPTVVGNTSAYVGFTGGTGGLTAVQSIQTWTFTPNPGAFNAPSDLVATPQNGPQVQLSWNDNSTTETGFTIERATDAAFTQNVTTTSAPANATATATYVDTTVVPGNTYFYRVVAIHAAFTTAFSNAVDAVIPTPPATPSDGHATLITDTTVDLAWTNNATNADVYKIFREVVGGAFTQIASLPGNATSFDDSGLTPGTNYDYHIEAWNISGAADRTGANLYTVSPAITNLVATVSGNSVSLSWSAPPGATNLTYNVYRGTSPGGEAATPIALGLTSTSFTDSNLAAGATYYYKVTSVDPESLSTPSVAPFGESAPSNEVNVASTTTTLTDNGISANTAGGSIEVGSSLSFTVAVKPTSGGPVTGTVQLEDAANGNALVGSAQTLSGGSATFSITASAANNLGVGTHQLFAVYTASGSFLASQSGQVGQVIDSVFKVQTIGTSAASNLTQGATGFVVVFNAPVNVGGLNLYGAGVPSLTFMNGSTPVNGTLVFDATGTRATFVVTGTFPAAGTPLAGLLNAGSTYTVDLSGTNASAFADTNGHTLGSASGTGGADFITSFTSANSATAVTVSLPYFARGYSQAVDVPASGSNGLPISIQVPAGGTAVSSASFDLFYDPALLTVSGGTIIASGFTGSVKVLSPGEVQVTMSGGNLAPGKLTNVVSLTASVPSTAPYRAKEILDIQNISINGGTNNGQDGSAVHAATFLDATLGPAIPSTYSAQDAFNVLKASTGLSGAIYNNLLDPVIVTDDLGLGRTSAQDAFDVLKKSVGLSVPQIPDLPTGGTPPAVGGPDPYLYLDAMANAAPGTTVTVHVNLQSLVANGFTFDSSDLAIGFDPTKVQISNVRAGAYAAVAKLGSSLVVGANLNTKGGTLFISVFTSNVNGVTIPDGVTGDLVDFDLTVLRGVTGATVLKLNANIGQHYTDVNGGQATLSPAPDNSPYNRRTDIVIGPNAVNSSSAPVLPAWYFTSTGLGAAGRTAAALQPKSTPVNETNAFWAWLGSKTSVAATQNLHTNVVRSPLGSSLGFANLIDFLDLDMSSVILGGDSTSLTHRLTTKRLA